MYDKQAERSRIKQLLQDSKVFEQKLSRRENFKRAVSISLDELSEIEQAFAEFEAKVSHLVVYRQLFQPDFSKQIKTQFERTAFFLEKDYTQEDKDQMSDSVYRRVKESQNKRIDVFREIGQVYLKRPSSPEHDA